jgi:hypothetical protein
MNVSHDRVVLRLVTGGGRLISIDYRGGDGK